MKEASRVIMGATLVMVLSLAIVLCLVLVLLAELYCSLLLRRRRQQQLETPPPPKSSVAAVAEGTPVSEGTREREPMRSPMISSFIYQGVLDAPRSFLFPKLPSKREQRRRREELDDIENQCCQFRNFLGLDDGSPGSDHPGLHWSTVSPSEPAGPSSSAVFPAEDVITIESTTGDHQVGRPRGKEGQLLVYISNPVYDRDPYYGLSKRRIVDTPPFETPDTSPSRFETDGSSGEDEGVVIKDSTPYTTTIKLDILVVGDMIEDSTPCVGSISQQISTPPLTPMKELPAKACSVPLMDAGSLVASSGSESNSHNGASSSTLGTPCTSPSW